MYVERSWDQEEEKCIMRRLIVGFGVLANLSSLQRSQENELTLVSM